MGLFAWVVGQRRRIKCCSVQLSGAGSQLGTDAHQVSTELAERGRVLGVIRLEREQPNRGVADLSVYARETGE
ncbi:hypothetical protein [Amycolatopsis balhimycina]|uniref:hypothetical protein n=1 Tax=Amycolatopsis balhimycina TaxID=208443 RepID=UPI00146A781A